METTSIFRQSRLRRKKVETTWIFWSAKLHRKSTWKWRGKLSKFALQCIDVISTSNRRWLAWCASWVTISPYFYIFSAYPQYMVYQYTGTLLKLHFLTSFQWTILLMFSGPFLYYFCVSLLHILTTQSILSSAFLHSLQMCFVDLHQSLISVILFIYSASILQL